ncbi:MAG: SDR family NAD(P)-dependent oxidoreductase [Hyphomicrobiaceae bacterium]|nr:SDR family NAD(P)-dependent oxidoreductase [Hyphomicrobiaceae bacterium]
MSVPQSWKVVWITGASTGIGRELALALAKAGVAVAASARSRSKLDELKSQHPLIRAYPLDVTDESACRETAAQIGRDLGAIDLAILNAGVWVPMDAAHFDPAGIAESMAVNYTGVVNALDPLIRDMTARRTGHIALVSSVAGYRGLPGAVAYAPTKAAVIALAEALYLDLRDSGVALSIVNPGFVDTPMTKVNNFPMPFMISADDAAGRIIRGLAARRYEIAFPLRMKLLAKFMRLMPNAMFFAISDRLSEGSGELPPRPPRAEG